MILQMKIAISTRANGEIRYANRNIRMLQ